MKTFVIVNPKSRLGQTGERVEELARLLTKHVAEHVLLTTCREGDGERLAREAQAAGATRIVVAGGDGTVSEVVTGLLAEHGKTAIELGLLPLGTGRDFARLLRLGRELEPAVARLSHGKTRRVDAGKVRTINADGVVHSRCFLNIASFGLTGESARWLKEQAANGKRGRASYLMSSVVGLARYATPRITLTLDGQTIHDAPLWFAAAANGQYFAGGMQVAPEAQIGDGLLDVVIVPKLPMVQALARFPLIMRGKHVDGRKIRMLRGRALEASSGAASVWLEADGEVIGRLPARIEILPAAITLCGLP